MIQCARQPGLASVWESIMGFDGAPQCSGTAQAQTSLLRGDSCIPQIRETLNPAPRIVGDENHAVRLSAARLVLMSIGILMYEGPDRLLKLPAAQMTSFMPGSGPSWRAARSARRCSCSRMRCRWACAPLRRTG